MSFMPGSMLGMLGGGQLGRMFITAAQSMGYRVTVLDPAADCPAGGVADRFLCAEYTDESALSELGKTCVAVTTEFENIPAASLCYLKEFCVVHPDANSVSIAQNRIIEKQFLVEHGFSVAPFAVIQNGDMASSFVPENLFPGILKVSQFGYDGKGQIAVKSIADLDTALANLNYVSCVLEQLIPLDCEVSVVVARAVNSTIQTYSVSKNQHVNGILDVSIVPAPISKAVLQQAKDIARQVVEALDYIGVLCVEFFVSNDGELLVNEIAPRPHNSGHYTINACFTSQFEQQVRTLCELPLGSTHQHSAAVMVNLLGDLWAKKVPDWNLVLQHPQAKLHLYGKHEARPKRKMGHFTVLDLSTETALKNALQIRALLDPNQDNE